MWITPIVADPTGYVAVLMCSGVDLVPMRLADYTSIHYALDQDLEFVAVTDIYGDPHRIRVREIADLARCSPEGLKKQDAERLKS